MRSISFVLLILALFSIQAYSYDHIHCTHDQIDHKPELLDIEEDMNVLEGRGLASYPQLRIYPYYGAMATDSATYRSYVQYDLVPPVVSYFQAALRVKYPVSGKLKIPVSSICGISTPSVLRSTGVSADFAVAFDATSDSSSWIAESTACYLASGTRRTLAAKTLLNRNYIQATTNVLEHEKNTYVMIHELMHVFGFSSSLYGNFMTSSGQRRTGHVKSIKIGSATRKVLDIPSLTAKMRNYFGCSTLEGAYMENSGSSGTAGSHFERRFFLYETMTSGSIHGRRVSELSLGVLEASGWYEVNYAYAEPFWFGKGKGCSFIRGTCSSTSFSEFCSSSSISCSVTGRGGATCRSDDKSDGCKYYNPILDYDCENTRAESFARLPSLQVFGRGAGSKCFSGTLSTSSGSSQRSFCFKYTCSGSQLLVHLGSKSVACTKKGAITVSGYRGSINCPDPVTFCNTVGKKYCPRGCMGRGTCVNYKCVCKSGYKGVDCGLRA